jgi:hypothetical protein
MSRLPIRASATLMFGLVIAAGGSTPAAARVYTYGASLDCGARLVDVCVPACDRSVSGGPGLGKCHVSCSRDAGICEARRIPVSISYPPHSRHPVGRK